MGCSSSQTAAVQKEDVVDDALPAAHVEPAMPPDVLRSTAESPHEEEPTRSEDKQLREEEEQRRLQQRKEEEERRKPPTLLDLARSDNAPAGIWGDIWMQSSFGLQLDDLVLKHPYLEPQHCAQRHPLHNVLRRCRQSSELRRFGQANAHLQRIKAGLHAEEKLVNQAFRYFDLDKSGHIDESEFRQMCAYLGWGDAEKVKLMDLDGDGKVTLPDLQGFAGHMGGVSQLFERRRLRISASRHDVCDYASITVGTRVLAHFYTRQQKSLAWKEACVTAVGVEHHITEDLMGPVTLGVELEFRFGPGDRWGMRQVVPMSWVIANIEDATVVAALREVGILDEQQALWALLLPSTEMHTISRLANSQQIALKSVREKASKHHEDAVPDVLARFRKLGYDQDELQAVLGWIQDLAPIIIHLNIDEVGRYLEIDETLRSQFEVRGEEDPKVVEKVNQERHEREKRLFGGCYDDVEPFERVKYGALNVLNDFHGSRKAHVFGDSYLVLKDVRLRTTFTAKDSADCTLEDMGLLDKYAHVLAGYQDQELREVVAVATAAIAPASEGVRPKGAASLELLRGTSDDPTAEWITVGFPNLKQSSGCYYFEVHLYAGCKAPQVGLLSSKFEIRPNTASTSGVGDDAHGWSVDGLNAARWHNGESKAWTICWGRSTETNPSTSPETTSSDASGDSYFDEDSDEPSEYYSESYGDESFNIGGVTSPDGLELSQDVVVGVAVDLDERTLRFSSNGRWESSPAFTSTDIPEDNAELYPAISLRGRATFIFGPKWKHSPPLTRHPTNAKPSNNNSTGAAGTVPAMHTGTGKAGSSSAALSDPGQKVVSVAGWASQLVEAITLVTGPGLERNYGRKGTGAHSSSMELADSEFLTRVDQGEAGTGEGLGASLTFHSDTRVLGKVVGTEKGTRESTFRAPHGTHITGLVFEGNKLKSLDVACRDSIGIQMKPGPTGLVVDADNGKVISVTQNGQAQFRGVDLGWVLQGIDGQPYTEDVLQTKADSNAPYTLTFKCRGLMTVVFQPGELGLQIDTENGEILSVADGSQAQMNSVREKWVISLVDGERFNDELMKQKIAGKDAFTVGFRQHRSNVGSTKTTKLSPFAQWPGTPGTTVRIDCPEIGDSNKLTNYKEVQVHGEVNLKRNVQRLVVNSKYRIRPKTQRSFRLRVMNAGPCNGIYHRMGAQGGRPLYKSTFGTMISWDPEESVWKASASPDSASAGRVFASAPAGDGEPGEPPTSGWRVPDHEWGILELPDFEAALRDNGIEDTVIKRLKGLLTVQETTRWGEHIFKKTRNASFAEEWKKIKNPPISADALWKEAIQKMQQRKIREAGLPDEALIVETHHPYKAEPWSMEVAIPGVPSLAVHFATKTCTLDGRAALSIAAGGLDRATAGPGARVEVVTVSGTVRGTLSERTDQIWCIRIDRRGTSPAPIKPSSGNSAVTENNVGEEVSTTQSMGPSEANSQASFPVGGDSSSAWHPQVGEVVEAQFQSGAWYKATITSVRNRGFDWYTARWQPARFVVQWADGEKKDVEKIRQQLRKPLIPPVVRTQMDLEEVPRFSSLPLAGAECFARCAEAPRIAVATYGVSKQDSLSETFGPGPPGFKHDPGTGHLREITKGGKAEEKGLKPDWVILSIDSESYTSELLDKKVASGSSYVVKFRHKSPLNIILEPGQPGVSIDSKTAKVTAVVDGGQAHKKGISKDYILEYIDGQEFTDELLKAKIAGSVQYSVGLRLPVAPGGESLGAENLTVGSEIKSFSLDRTHALAPITISSFVGMGPAQAENVAVGWYLDVVATAQGLYGSSGADFLRLLDGIGGVKIDTGTGKLLDAAFANAEELLRRLNEELLPLTGLSLVFTNSPSTEKARLLGEVVAVYPEGQIVGSEIRLFKVVEKTGTFGVGNKHVQVDSYLAPGPAQTAGIRADWILDIDATRAVNPGKSKDLDTNMVQQNPNVLLPMSGITLVFKLPSMDKAEMFSGSGDADADKWSCPELPGDSARFNMPFTDVSGDPDKRWGIWALVLPSHAPQPSREQVDQLADQCVEATRRAQGIEKEMRVERDDWGEARLRALCERHGWDFEWMSTDGERRRRAMERQYFLQDTQEMVGVREVVKAVAQCRKGAQERSSCSL